MTFVEKRIARGMITIDGYSKAKTLKGALKDLAREIAKCNPSEASAITDYIDETITILNQENTNWDEYAIQAEEVGCASIINEKTDETEYAEGNYYLCIRFIA